MATNRGGSGQRPTLPPKRTASCRPTGTYTPWRGPPGTANAPLQSMDSLCGQPGAIRKRMARDTCIQANLMTLHPHETVDDNQPLLRSSHDFAAEGLAPFFIVRVAVWAGWGRDLCKCLAFGVRRVIMDGSSWTGAPMVHGTVNPAPAKLQILLCELQSRMVTYPPASYCINKTPTQCIYAADDR